jgi:hypothetical protein
MTTRLRTTGTASLAAALLALIALAAPAFAAPTGATGTETVSAAAGATDKTGSPAKPKAIKLKADGAYRYRGHSYVLPRTKLSIRGRVKGDLGSKSVDIEIFKRGKLIKRKSVDTETKKGVTTFHYNWRTGKKGHYSIKVGLSNEQSAIVSRGKGTTVAVVRTSIHSGSRGIAVRLFQHELRQLSYVAPLNGHFDSATGRAFIAGMARRASAGSGVARKLVAGKGAFHLRYPGAGRHVEVSIRKQVMAFANKGKVVRIYHVSTGAPATPTIRGTYRVYMKDPGTNAKGMVKSSYFRGGYAIHGYAEVPVYNASHGCVRVPVPSAGSIYAWVHMGTRVDTYY